MSILGSSSWLPRRTAGGADRFELDALGKNGDGRSLYVDFTLQVEDATIFQGNVRDNGVTGPQLGFCRGIRGRDLELVLLVGAR